jgi:hypothetical protein
MYTRCSNEQTEADPSHPGPINNVATELKAITDQEPVDKLDLAGEFVLNLQLKRTMKEDQDYIVVD